MPPPGLSVSHWLADKAVTLFLAITSCLYFCMQLTLLCWRWRQCVPSEQYISTRLCGVTPQNMVIFIFICFIMHYYGNMYFENSGGCLKQMHWFRRVSTCDQILVYGSWRVLKIVSHSVPVLCCNKYFLIIEMGCWIYNAVDYKETGMRYHRHMGSSWLDLLANFSFHRSHSLFLLFLRPLGIENNQYKNAESHCALFVLSSWWW
jgi:hypothetical protein